jgi:site-specific recombinase XerD
MGAVRSRLTMEFLQREELAMATDTTDTPISPLRQRMQHDMMMRGLGPHTQKDYIQHVRRLAAFLGRPPDTASEEDLRRFQIHQHEAGASAPTINGTVSALRFFFGVTQPALVEGRAVASDPRVDKELVLDD